MARLNHSMLTAFSNAMLGVHAPADEETFPAQANASLAKLFPDSMISYNSFTPSGLVAIAYPQPFSAEAVEVFSTYVAEHPSLTYLMESGSKEPVCISDFATRTEWERTHLYNELFRPLRIRVQLGAVLKSEVGALGFSINRWTKDFSAEERTLLALAMPHLFQGWRRAATWTRMHATLGSLSVIEVDSRGAIRFCTLKAQQLMEDYFGTGALARGHVPDALRQWISAHAHKCADVAPIPSFMLASLQRRLVVRLVSRGAETFTLAVEQTALEHTSELLEGLGLTPREAEILLWISHGKTNAEIAIIIDSKTRTVAKHVEHIFAKLGVETRTAAAAMAWAVFRGV